MTGNQFAQAILDSTTDARMPGENSDRVTQIIHDDRRASRIFLGSELEDAFQIGECARRER